MWKAVQLIVENGLISLLGAKEVDRKYVKSLQQHTTDYWVKKFEASARKLISLIANENESKEDDINFLKECIETMETISLVAPAHDYRNLQANGYRSSIKLLAKMFESMTDSNISYGHRMEFISCMKRIKIYLDFFQDYHQEDQVNNYDHEKQKELAQEIIGQFNHFELWSMLHKHPLVFLQLNDELRVILRFYLRCFPLFLNRIPFIDGIKSLLSESAKARILERYFQTLQPADMMHILSWGDSGGNVLTSSINLYKWFTGWDSNTHVRNVITTINSQYLLKVTVDGVEIKKSDKDCQGVSNIRYQVARTDPEKWEESKYYRKMLIYVHGGCFLGPTAHATENLCVTTWARSMPGLTVINFDYTVCPKARFPTQVQELLDFYLWLTGAPSRDEVIKMFGFFPIDVVFAGESAGGQITTSFFIVLNELKELHESALKFPKGFLLMFPKVCMTFQMFPSHLSSAFEPFIYPQLLPVCCISYVPMKRYDASSGTYTLISLEEQTSMDRDSVFEEGNEMIQSFLLNPFEYQKFDTMKEIPLHILSFEYDPFLDEAIQFAKKWKGKVDFRVLNDLGHASHLMGPINYECRKAHEELIDLMKCSLA